MEHLPLYKSTKGDITTQFDMRMSEEMGLLKMDFLGLRTLTVIDKALRLVQESHGEAPTAREIPTDDPATYRLLQEGRTVGVFQLESPPMRQLLKAMAPNSFEDVSAVLALYRPGPMSVNMHYDYADRKNERKPVEYFHDDAEEVLDDTYGLMIYQESVMRVAQKFAGYSLAEADNLRKAELVSEMHSRSVLIASDSGARLIACYTETGSTALQLAGERPPTDVVGFSPSQRTVQKLTLVWGVIPRKIRPGRTSRELTLDGDRHIR